VRGRDRSVREREHAPNPDEKPLDGTRRRRRRREEAEKTPGEGDQRPRSRRPHTATATYKGASTKGRRKGGGELTEAWRSWSRGKRETKWGRPTTYFKTPLKNYNTYLFKATRRKGFTSRSLEKATVSHVSFDIVSKPISEPNFVYYSSKKSVKIQEKYEINYTICPP
jgi:hypothetical protein